VSGSSSRIPGFYKLDVAERRERLAARNGVTGEDLSRLESGGIDVATADGMIENVIGTFALPLGVALNFRVDEVDYVVPMAIEEASVVAAASYAARMVRDSGGFHAVVSPPVMIGQVQLTDIADPDAAVERVHAARGQVLELAKALAPRLCERGGGPVDVRARVLSRPGDPDGGMIVVHVLVDCRDAMGANLVNSIAEGVADRLAEVADGTVGLRIVSNLSDERTVAVTARVTDEAIGGAKVREAIVAASRFAELDPYRAATHNKGIMNGIDAVLLATANDWRSENDVLVGELALPLAVGTIGGATRGHAGAELALALLAVEDATTLAAVIASAGLAANLAALRALATDGIQRGHMSLHARVVARAAGATGDLIDRVAAEISAMGDVKPDRAKEILARLRATGLASSLTLKESP
jgi:hydroxymethylglutaryl-CoA reductase